LIDYYWLQSINEEGQMAIDTEKVGHVLYDVSIT